MSNSEDVPMAELKKRPPASKATETKIPPLLVGELVRSLDPPERAFLEIVASLKKMDDGKSPVDLKEDRTLVLLSVAAFFDIRLRG